MLKDMQKLAEQLHAPKTWPTHDGKMLDRSEFLTSSEVAQCLRKSYFEKHTNRRVFDNNGYAERGHAIEAWIVNRLKVLQSEGYRLLYMGDEQRSFYDADLGLSGTPDGLIRLPNSGAYILAEFKSIDPRTNKRALPKRKHVYQVQQNMMLVEHCLNIKVAKAVLLYIDASDVFDQNEFVIEPDDGMLRDVHDRAATLWAATKADDLPAEGLQTGDCDNCKFTGECSGLISAMKRLEQAGAVNFSESPPAPLDADAVALVNKYLVLRDTAKRLTDEVEVVSDEVRSLVIASGGVLSGGNKMIVVEVSPGRETLDKDLVMALAGDGYNDLLKVGKPFTTMKVK